MPKADDLYKAKDIEEMNGHFFIGQELSEEIMKSFHYELKVGVFEDRANGYAIGDYKKRVNTVGGIVTAKPQDVASEIGKLLSWYRAQDAITLETLANFHIRYETIHPFQDGNGRTGTLRMGNPNGGSELAELFRHEQEQYAKLCDLFDVYGRYEDYLNSTKHDCS